MVVVEIASPRTAAKYLFASPPASANARIMTIVAITPDRRLTLIGVPKRAENRPRNRGAAPSRAAIA